MRRDVTLTWDDSGREAETASDLGHAFLQAAARRLGLVALTVAGAVTVGVVLNTVGRSALGWGNFPAPVRLLGQSVLLILSLGMFWLSRSGYDPRRILNLGLAYQILGAVLVVLPRYVTDQHLQLNSTHVGWLGVWILIFPLVVPARPAKNIGASLLAASAAPAVFLLYAFAEGRPLPSFRIFVGTFFPYYFCSALGVFPALLVYRLGREVTSVRREIEQLGGYTLLDLLGRGGMGEVWRAEHLMLARPAAIKLIKPERLSQGTLAQRSEIEARFAREAKATATLSSPHTINLFDYGATDDGTLYYVMELLDGIDLDSLITQFGPISPSRAIHLLAQACDSLGEAHDAGLIHRDVKPANVFCCRTGCQVDFVKVLDFGLVRHDRKQRTDEKDLTDEHIVGTPAFMAPEQAECRPGLDGRVDIYALGALGFWLLTGTHVFESETTVGMLVNLLKTPAGRVSERLGTPFPADLDDLLLSCLAKDPAQRPKSANALREGLLACDVPPWSQDDARAWWSERLPDAAPVDRDASTLAPLSVKFEP